MKERLCFLILGFMLIVSQFSLAEPKGQSKSFAVNKGGSLEVSINAGDILIKTWEKNEVLMKADGMDEEEFGMLDATQSGNTVRVEYASGWGTRLEISIPSEFNLDASTSVGEIEIQGKLAGRIIGSTSAGEIHLGSVEGQVQMTTSGGNIYAERIQGTATLKTSGGEIEVGVANGDLEVVTSGGNIDVGDVQKSLKAKTAGGDISAGNVGGEARVSTGGGNVVIGDVRGDAFVSTGAGDIEIGKVAGNASLTTGAGSIQLLGGKGTVKGKTSGGDVTMEDVQGIVDAKTAGGDISVELTPSEEGNSTLISAGGDIMLYLPENAKATVDAVIQIQGRWKTRSEDYDIVSDLKPQTYTRDEEKKEIRATFILNGGGHSVELKTANGNIELGGAPRAPAVPHK